MYRVVSPFTLTLVSETGKEFKKKKKKKVQNSSVKAIVMGELVQYLCFKLLLNTPSESD